MELMESVADVPVEKVWVHPSARRLLAWAGAEPGNANAGDEAAAMDPSAWRELERAHHYNAVVVAGNWSEIGPLVMHLRESPDFYIDQVDAWGVVFRRGSATLWTPPEVHEIALGESEGWRAAILSRMAMILQAMGENRAAQSAIATAMELNGEDAHVQARKATLDLQRGRLHEAVSGADLVLRTSPDHVAALQIKAQALSRGGASDQAWEVAEHLVRVASPNDMISLALHAQLANDARAFSREQESLEALVRFSEQAGVDPVMYRVLLGQCYARLGLGRQAMEQFLKVQSLESLPAAARSDVDAAIGKLKRTGF